MSAKWKFDLTGAEPIVRDLNAVNDTYQYGEILKAGAAEAGGCASMGAGSGKFIGVCNEGGATGSVLAGTQAAGTIEQLKAIVNPYAVYAVPYDNSAQITWVSPTTTTIPFTCTTSEGHPNIGGGWAWSYATGYLDYIVSSATSGTACTLTTVTGTNTSSATGILLYPAGSGLPYIIELNTNALTINADEIDLGTLGTTGVSGIVLANVIESATYGSEWLKPAVHNKVIRKATSRDYATAHAYVCFYPGSQLNVAA